VSKKQGKAQLAEAPRGPITWAKALGYAAAFSLGAMSAAPALLLFSQGSRNPATLERLQAGTPGRRTVARLAALPDAQLEQVDLVEMSIAVAREIPGLEKLDYERYRQIVDGWTAGFRRWLPTVEQAFQERPEYFHSDINFFRLGMLAQFLDEQVGIAYVEEQKQAQIEERKTGKKAEALYTEPGHLLLHGLIDSKRGTCGTMPTLHVAIGRRLGWPVGLACAESHYVCRYDDGKAAYNIEATDTGRGGFAAGSDEDYVKKQGVSRKAIALGSDLRKLTAREMLGVFVQARGRHFADTGKFDRAARDYALAHTLFPKSRKVYVGLVGSLLPVGEKLFMRGEHGHPVSLAAYLTSRYQPRVVRSGGPARRPAFRRDPIAELDRINAENRAAMRRLMQPPVPPQAQQPSAPGAPQPPQPHRPR